MDNSIVCPSYDIANKKWGQLRIRVDGKIFPCCVYLYHEPEFDLANLGNSAEDFEKNIAPTILNFCKNSCSSTNGTKHYTPKKNVLNL